MGTGGLGGVVGLDGCKADVCVVATLLLRGPNGWGGVWVGGWVGG